jgi:hypothetical protein
VNPLTTLNLLQFHGLSGFEFLLLYTKGTSIAPKGTLQRHSTPVGPLFLECTLGIQQKFVSVLNHGSLLAERQIKYVADLIKANLPDYGTSL